jgi:hypothetical protein
MATSRLFVVASSLQVNDNFQQLLMNTSRNEKHVNQLLFNGKMDVMMGICLPIIDHKSGKGKDLPCNALPTTTINILLFIRLFFFSFFFFF